MEKKRQWPLLLETGQRWKTKNGVVVSLSSPSGGGWQANTEAGQDYWFAVDDFADGKLQRLRRVDK